MHSKKPPPTIRQLCEGMNPKDEHLIVCPVCGQMFDGRDGALVEHHSEPKHRPKLH